MATAEEILALQTDPVFLARLTVAFSQAAYAAATAAPDPQATPEQIKTGMDALKFLVDNGPAQAQEDLKKSLMLVLGAPAIAADGAAISDADLLAIAQTLLQTYVAYRAVGGTL